jgi:hypothetical protein
MNNLNQNETYITISNNSLLDTKASLNETIKTNSDINFLLEEYEKLSDSINENLNNE